MFKEKINTNNSFKSILLVKTRKKNKEKHASCNSKFFEVFTSKIVLKKKEYHFINKKKVRLPIIPKSSGSEVILKKKKKWG